jgi:hypothetical protein
MPMSNSITRTTPGAEQRPVVMQMGITGDGFVHGAKG